MWRGYWYRFGSLITAVASPSLTKQLFSYSILGFALTETITITLIGFFLLCMGSNTHNFAYAKLFANHVISRSLLGFTVEKLMERIQQSCLVLFIAESSDF
jgi:hypothetical protein